MSSDPSAAVPETLYRIRPKVRFDVMDMTELMSALFVVKYLPAPEDPQLPEVACYCHGEGCAVREFTASLKLRGGPMPVLKCPACGGPGEKLHYLAYDTLMPVT